MFLVYRTERERMLTKLAIPNNKYDLKFLFLLFLGVLEPFDEAVLVDVPDAAGTQTRVEERLLYRTAGTTHPTYICTEGKIEVAYKGRCTRVSGAG